MGVFFRLVLPQKIIPVYTDFHNHIIHDKSENWRYICDKKDRPVKRLYLNKSENIKKTYSFNYDSKGKIGSIKIKYPPFKKMEEERIEINYEDDKIVQKTIYSNQYGKMIEKFNYYNKALIGKDIFIIEQSNELPFYKIQYDYFNLNDIPEEFIISITDD